MLGYHYAVRGAIDSGNRLGTAWGYPTVNLPIDPGKAIPRYGVYASRVMIEGRIFTGATNIGVHPTVKQQERPVCETFLIGYGGGDLYGKSAVCELIRFLRPERRFSSAEALRAQIEKDVKAVNLNFDEKN